ncbi:MAG: cytochrome c-type biogenesis protein CcmH [Paracoccaceae bacterium]|nr:cytochrome c-type biogenesis protein CcmH [Paracoccaceae bacterium]
MKKAYLILVLILVAFPNFLLGVEPDEILKDEKLESRARLISKELRCLVCQNENIDSSNAELARDLRLLVRERLVLGDSDEAVIVYVVKRYGEFVLLTPKFTGKSLILWLVGPIVLLSSIFFLLTIHRRSNRLLPEENLKLNDIEEEELKNYFKKK